MPRRGRSAPTPRRSHSPKLGPAHPPPPPPPTYPPPVHQPPPPHWGQMASTAGGIAAGAVIGQNLGDGLANMVTGRSSQAATPAQAQPIECPGSCTWESNQLLHCVSNQSNLNLCLGFKEAMQNCREQCKINNHVTP